MLNKTAFLLVLLLLSAILFADAQSKYITRNGFVGFYGHTSMEDIKADNNQVGAILVTDSGKYVFTILIKSFEFDRYLMQEHFNENYMESDKYPKAIFIGKIKDLSKVNFKKDGEYNVVVDGNLTIKNKTNPVSVSGSVIIKGGNIESKAKFNITPEDYNIEIPSVVRDKIAKQMEVTVDVKMDPVK